MYSLDELDIYNLSQEFSDEVWFIVEKWESFPKFGLGKQLTDAADSISSNIAEGYGRYFIKENMRFCFYSRGSILESENHLRKAKNRSLITEEVYTALIGRLLIIHKKLNSYIKVLRNNLVSLAKKKNTPLSKHE